MRRDGTTRRTAALAAGLCVPVGLGAKRVPVGWVANHLAGGIYVVFWCCAALVVLPRARRSRVVPTVLALTCAIEFLQRSDAGWLERLRASRPGGLLLGSTFSWTDFPYYVAGACAAWWLAGWITAPERARARRA